MKSKYSAFISYGHAADAELAPLLQTALHRFAKPFYKLRALRIFRDKTNLHLSPGLWPLIAESIAGSEYFILLASPDAASSSWVEREVGEWLRVQGGSGDRLLIVLTGGEIAWDPKARDFDWTKTTALPPNLAGVYEEMPLFSDLRWAQGLEDLSLRHPQFLDEVANLAATLHGREKDAMVGEDVRQHRRFKLAAMATFLLLSALTVATTAFGWYANREQREAERQSNVALSRQHAAQAVNLLGREADQGMALSASAYRQNVNAVTYGSLAAAAQQSSRAATFLHGSTTVGWAVAFDSASRLLASANADGTITLWDVATSRLVCRLRGRSRGMYSLAFAPRRPVLVSGDEDGGLQLWDAEHCKWLLSRPAAHKKAVQGLAFSPDGRVLASGGTDGAIHVWQAGSLAPIATPKLPVEGKAVRGVAFSRDGTWLASGGKDGKVRLWRTGLWTPDGSPLDDDAGEVNAVAFSPVDDLLASAHDSLEAILWDARNHRKMAMGLGEAQLTPGHTATVMGVAFSPDGRKLATASVDSTILLWNTSQESERPEMLSAHRGQVNSVAFSPDGRWLASCGWDSNVILWDTRHPSRLASTEAVSAAGIVGIAVDRKGSEWAAVDSTGEVTVGDSGGQESFSTALHRAASYMNVRFSPDGMILAGAGDDGTIDLWDARNHRPLGEPLRGHKGKVYDLAFSSQGVLASAGQDGTVILWDVARRRPVQTLYGHIDEVNFLAFSPDGRRLVSASDDGYLLVWDVEKRSLLARLNTKSSAILLSVAYSPDGRWIAAGGGDHRVTLWDAERFRILAASEDLKENVQDLRFNPRDPRLLFSLDAGNRVVRWETTGGHLALRQSFPMDENVTTLALSPEGRFLAVGGEKLYVADLEKGALHDLATPKDGKFLGVEFDPQGRLAASDNNRNVLFWEHPIQGGPPLLAANKAGKVTAMALSPDGSWVAIGDEGGTLALWDLRTRQNRCAPIETQQKTVNGLAISPDGNLVASAGENGTVRLWRLSGCAPSGTIQHLRDGKVYGVQFSPDQRTLATAGSDNRIKLWSLADPTRCRELPPTLEGHGNTVYCLAFWPLQGSVLASGSRDRNVLLWDLARHRQRMRPLLGHSDEVKALSFSPDGQLLATASVNQTIMLWNAETGDRIGYWLRTPGKLRALAFWGSEFLLSGGDDGTVTRWDLRPKSWLKMVDRVTNGSLEQGSERLLELAPTGEGAQPPNAAGPATKTLAGS
jgi:WD40 repeat protein